MKSKRKVRVREDVIDGEPVYRVELTQGRWAIVDKKRWWRIAAKYGPRWQAVPNGRNDWYARKRYRNDRGRRVPVALAQVIAGRRAIHGRAVPINGDSLDVRASNLSIAGKQLDGTPVRVSKPQRGNQSHPMPARRSEPVHEDERSRTAQNYSDERPRSRVTVYKRIPCSEYKRRLKDGEPMHGLDPWTCAKTCTQCGQSESTNGRSNHE